MIWLAAFLTLTINAVKMLEIEFLDCPPALIDEQLVTQILLRALEESAFEAPDHPQVAIKYMSDKDIRILNRDFRGQDKPTNVLSFPNDEGGYLGDIALSGETIAREAQEQEKPEKDHMTHMILHGFLHLLGYDHVEETEAEEMEALEIRLLEEFKVKNPYL